MLVSRRLVSRRFVSRILGLTLAALCSPLGAADLAEIQIRDTVDPGDDYITWAPASAQIRLASVGTGDVTVVLTNDDGSNGGGDLLFDHSVEPGNTATQESLNLTLPSNGDWVPFVVAGRYGHPSVRDKDAVIEVHRDTASGELVASHALMVRVRKNALNLTDHERTEFLRALADLHFVRDEYIHFVMVHNAAAFGKFGRQGWDYPDQAHGGSAFIAWHRLFLLEFERKLQEKFPHVALPYWVQDVASNVFEEDFLGANGTEGGSGFAVLAADNPIFGWEMPPTIWWNPPQFETTEHGSAGAILRDNRDRQSPEYLTQFNSESKLFKDRSNFEEFTHVVERNPHGNGHNTAGPWMGDCRISPRDPIFWVFHSQHDHLWARWQWTYGRFGTDGGNPDDYSPTGTYQAGEGFRGHFLEDTIWPWNGEQGGPEDDRDARQPPVRLEKFAPSTVPGLWPENLTVPRPADTIDYTGLAADRLDMGFAYDDVPYGSKSLPIVEEASLRVQRSTALVAGGNPEDTFLDPKKPTEVRMAAADRIRLTRDDSATPYLSLIRDPSEPAEIRAEALRLLANAGKRSFIPDALELVRDEGQLGGRLDDAALDAAAARVLAVENMFFSLEPSLRMEIHQALRGLLEDPRHEVRELAMANLAPMGDDEAVKVLREDLGRDRPLFARRHAIAWLAAAESGQNAEALRPFLDDEDTGVRVTTIRALGHDPNSQDRILALIGDINQPEAVRSAAIQALIHSGDDDFADALFALLATEGVSQRLQGEAAAALGLWARRKVPDMDDSQKLALLRRLLDCPEPVVETHAVILMRTLKRIHELSR